MELTIGIKSIATDTTPEKWQKRTVGTTMQLINGCPFKPEQWRTNGTPIIRIQNLTDKNSSFNYFDGKVDEKYNVSNGDVLFAWSGTTGSSFGAKIWEQGTGYLNQHIFRVVPDASLLTKYYSYLILKSVQASIEKQTHGFKSSFVHVKKTDLVKIPLAIPPLEEQQAISSALSDMDALLAKLDQLIAKKRDIKQAAMQELLTGRRRLPGFSAAWAAKRIDKVAPLQRGFDLTHSEVKPGPYPVAYSNGIANHHAEFKAKGPGIATGRSGTIGNVHYIESDYWPHNTSLFVTNFHGNDPKFVYYLFQHTKLAQFSTGSGVPTLNRNDVHAHVVQIPQAHEEQSAIAQALTDMDTEITALEARREKTRLIKQGMMQELLSGRVRLI